MPFLAELEDIHEAAKKAKEEAQAVIKKKEEVDSLLKAIRGRLERGELDPSQIAKLVPEGEKGPEVTKID